MKKLLLFFMSLLLFATHIAASEEEVFLGFWIPDLNNPASYVSEAGVYSKKDGEEPKRTTRYNAQFTYGRAQNAATTTTGNFLPADYRYSYVGAIKKFDVNSNDGTRGFTIAFEPELRTIASGGTNNSSSGYALRLEAPSSANSYGAWNGLRLSTFSYPYYPKITISSSSEWIPIKKVKFGKTRPFVSTSSLSYSLSSFTATDDIEGIFQRVSEPGDWEFDPVDNCWMYVLTVPSQTVEFTVAPGLNTGATSPYLNKLGIVWDAPIDAPSVDMSLVPKDGKLTEVAVNQYTYNYTETPTVLKFFTYPTGIKKMIYVTADGIPTSNWRVYSPSEGVVLPEAVWDQKTPVYIAGVDENGNIGMTLTVNCERKRPAAPRRPEVVRVAKMFEYVPMPDGYTIHGQTFIRSGWIDMSQEDQFNLEIQVDENAFVLDLRDAYNIAFLYDNQQVIDPDVVPVGKLQWAINSNRTPDDESFMDAKVNEGCTDSQWDDPKFGPQNGWFVFGYDINGKFGPNFSQLNLDSDESVMYLHLRAYSEASGDKFYGDPITIKLTRTPFAGPVLSKPKGENYTWVNGSVPRMSFAKYAEVQVTLPDDTPENTSIEFAFEGSDEPGLTPSQNATINTLMEYDLNGNPHIYYYSKDKPCILRLGVNELYQAAMYPGRLYVRSNNRNTNQVSAWTLLDIEPIVTENYYMDGYSAPRDGYDQNGLVSLYGGSPNSMMRVVDVFSTDAALENGKTTYYVYLENYKNDAIKLVINSVGQPAVLDTYISRNSDYRVIDGGEIVGRIAYRNFIDGKGVMPEILITPTKEESFINYLPEAKPYSDFYQGAPDKCCPDVTAVTDADFNKMVRVRGLEKIAGSSKVRGIDGTEYTIYTRLNLPNDKEVEDAIADMEDGNVYAITCFVGQTVGSLALLPCDMPLECPDTPELFAPNPITDGELDAISPELTITVGNIHQHNMTYYWTDLLGFEEIKDLDSYIGPYGLHEIQRDKKGVPTFVLPKDNYKLAGDGKRSLTLTVFARSESGLWSLEPAVIEIEWHELDKEHGTVSSIAEFKALYLDDKNLPGTISESGSRVSINSDHYHQFSPNSYAVVIEATEEWLYIRDLNTTRDDNKFHSENYILMHNENKWVNPPVPVAGVADSVRMLRRGDIINNFALIPALSRRGNLVSESTGFARTVHYIDSIPNFQLALREIEVGYSDPTWEPDPDNDDYSGYYANILLGENQRMRYLDIRSVKIQKKGADYFLVLGEGNIALAFDIFEECYNGWDLFYDPENPDELYNIKGVFLKNEKDRDESYAIAMIDFSTNKAQLDAPRLYCTEATNKDAELQYFVNELKVNIESEEGSSVFYSVNGVDPKNMQPEADGNYPNRLSFEGNMFSPTLPANSDRVTVKAYAYRPGYKPSPTVSRIFVRNSTEYQYIFQFLDQARAGRYYRMTANLKVIAVGGKYMFLADNMGYFLPVINEQGWNNTELAAGRYVKDFTVGYMVDTHSNRIAVATGHISTFNSVTSPSWSGDKYTPDNVQFHAEPDTLNSISILNARRLVTLMNVNVIDGETRTSEGEDVWYIQDGQTGQNFPMYVGKLGKMNVGSYNSDGTRVTEDLRDGASYNVTGFVMLGDPTGREGEVEFWPLMADRVTRSPRPTASFTNTLNTQQNSINGDYIVDFNTTTTVTLKSERSNTTIYYMIDSHNEDLSKATWYTYQHPFVVDKNDVVRVKCQEPAFAESQIIVITLNKVERAGDVNFNVTSEYGRTTVRLTTDEQGATIYYGINDPSCPSRYSSTSRGLTFTKGERLYACVQVSGKPRGAVSSLQVMVLGGTSSTVSGKVQFELQEGYNGTKLVKISPVDDLVEGTYLIFYTTKAGVPFSMDDWTEYTSPIEFTESSAVLAVLMELNKPIGEVAETYVFVGLVGIDGIDSDSTEADSVRVEGNNIIAPEGYEVYDLTGRKVSTTGLNRGIYIVRLPSGTGVKVMITI